MSNFPYVKTRREDVRPISEKQVPLVRKLLKWYTVLNVWVYKKSGGRLMKNFPGGYPLCVLASQGARTGKWREVALLHLPTGEDSLYLVASQGGMPVHPAWYHNVKANPEVKVTVGGETRRLQARQLSEEEKGQIWPELCAMYPDFDEYQARTDRAIPVFLCSPKET